MLPTMLVITGHAVERTAPTYTIQQVTLHKHFAGRLGYRIQTELSLQSASGTVTILIKDCRHSQIQGESSPYKSGDKVKISVSGMGARVELRPDQIKLIR